MSRRRSSSLCLGLAVLALGWPRGVGAQARDAAAGAAAGAVGGLVVSLGLTAATARAGHYVFSPRDAFVRLIPVPLCAVAGGVLGYQDPDRLHRGVSHGLWGLVAGAAAGTAIGALVSDDETGIVSGTLIGSAVGILAGAVWGAVTTPRDLPVPPDLAGARIPLTFRWYP